MGRENSAARYCLLTHSKLFHVIDANLISKIQPDPELVGKQPS